MTKSLQTMTAVERLAARLHEQTLDVANLRAVLGIQAHRISHMFVGCDVLPRTRRRRKPDSGTPDLQTPSPRSRSAPDSS